MDQGKKEYVEYVVARKIFKEGERNVVRILKVFEKDKQKQKEDEEEVIVISDSEDKDQRQGNGKEVVS